MPATFDGTRVDSADNRGSKWFDIGGGKAADETDFKFQGTQSVSEKVNNATLGIAFDDSGGSANTEDLTAAIVLFKVLVTTVGITNTRGPAGLNLELGSGGLRSAFLQWYFSGSDEYPAFESWLLQGVDLNVLEWIDETTGNPDETIIDYYGWEATITGTSKSENVAMDAVDHIPKGRGLTWVGSTGSFEDYLALDFAITTNRWGVVIEKEGVIYSLGVLTQGLDAATVFLAANRIVEFVAGFIGADSLGLVNSIGHASNDIDLNDCTFVGIAQDGQIHYFDNISSVDAGNNEIDIAAHKFETGDPVLYSLNGGSNAVGGLTDDTVYFVIKINAGAIALSDQRYAAAKGDTRLVLASATNFAIGGEISGDGIGGNTGTGEVVGISSNDVTVRTISGAWVAGNNVDNVIPFAATDTALNSIESTNGGIGLSDGASGENQKLTRQPDQRPDYAVTIAMTVASGTNFVVGGPITGDGDGGNTGVGIVRSKPSANVLMVQTLSGAWVTTNGVDNADPYSADETTISTVVATGDSDMTGGSLNNFRRVNLYIGATIKDAKILNTGKILPMGGTLDGLTISLQTTDEGEALIETDDLADMNDCSVAAGTEGHAVEIFATGTFAYNGNLFPGFWNPSPLGWNFSTAQAFTSEALDTDANHGFTSGEAVFYNDEGGVEGIGLTDGNKYYVNAIDANTVSVHRSREDAVADANRINLTTSGSETQSLYSARAALFNDSGGLVTVNVAGGGGTPSFRNGTGASTVVNNTVSVTIKCVDKADLTDIQNLQCAIYKTSDDSVVLAPTLTDVNGEVTTNYDPGASTDIYIVCRKGTASPKYRIERVIGTVLSGVNFNLTVLMTPDDIAA